MVSYVKKNKDFKTIYYNAGNYFLSEKSSPPGKSGNTTCCEQTH